MAPADDTPHRSRQRRLLCARIEALAHMLEAQEFEEVRPNAVPYLRGLARDVSEDRRQAPAGERRSYDSGPRLARTEWVAILRLLDFLRDVGVVLPLPLERVRELRERISGQLR